ncbi:hypothetical protein B0H19DRAFT_1331205 [Mycena capillaripes]|nr:hypothetical protein B0H19DRAFT_1331205 [Mycena capillaripes]
MSSSIVLYDIPSTLPNKVWSANTLKTRYNCIFALNYKGIPYKIVWLEAIVSDSSKITAYLDATYPDTPRLMPAGTIRMYPAFEDATSTLFSPLLKFTIPAINAKFNPVSEAQFRAVQEAAFGIKLEDMTRIDEAHVLEWQKVKDSFGKIDGWFRANGNGSAYLMGNPACYADLWMAAHLVQIKLVLPDSGRR